MVNLLAAITHPVGQHDSCRKNTKIVNIQTVNKSQSEQSKPLEHCN